jgi:hypothetical protein
MPTGNRGSGEEQASESNGGRSNSNPTARAYQILGVLGLVLGIIGAATGNLVGGISTIIASIFVMLFGGFVQIVADIRDLLKKRDLDA